MELAIVMPALLSTPDHLRYTAGTIASIKSRYDHRILLLLNRWEGFEVELEALATAHPLEMVRNPQPRSVAACWNYGLTWGLQKGASAVLVLNNDIVCKQNCVDRLVDFARHHPEFVLVTAWEHADLATLEDSEEREEWVESPHFSCFLAGKSLLERIGRFDEAFFPAYYEDNDMHHRIKLAGERAVCYRGARFYHHGSRTICVDPRLAEANRNSFTRNGEYYMAKWGGLPGRERLAYPAALVTGEKTGGVKPSWPVRDSSGDGTRPRLAMSALARRWSGDGRRSG